MNLLLDSHALLWWLQGDTTMPRRVRAMIENAANDIWVSPISLYELRVKQQKGRLANVPAAMEPLIAGQGFRRMDIAFAHSEAAARLPPHHLDPWDRLLIAQALAEDFAVVSVDRVFGRYGVRVVW